MRHFQKQSYEDIKHSFERRVHMALMWRQAANIFIINKNIALVGSSKPENERSNVVLPQPDGLVSEKLTFAHFKINTVQDSWPCIVL